MPRSNESYHQDSQSREWDGNERRSRPMLSKDMVAEIVTAINETHQPLSEDERRWVRLAIQREAQSIKLRQAIIEKTLGGLVWAGLIGFGILVIDYLKSHGVNIKP